ncbi:MAG: MucR family transcriptional regulator [bacterium]
MSKTLVEMAAEIVTAQASNTQMSSEEISDTLKRLFFTLKDIKDKEEGGDTLFEVAGAEKGQAVVASKDSIQRNKIVCLECGKEFKQLSKSHLKTHDLTPKDYKKKHGLKAGQALVAKSLTAKRRKLAKEKKLGSKLAEYRKKKAAGKIA